MPWKGKHKPPAELVVLTLKLRKAGDEYEVTEERGRYLVSFRVAKEIKNQKGGDPKSLAET